MQISHKLILRFTLLVSSILLAFSGTVFFFYAKFRTQEFYARLRTKARITEKILIKHDSLDVRLLRYIHKSDLSSLTQEKVSIFDPTNAEVYTSNEQLLAPIKPELLGTIRAGHELKFSQGNRQYYGILHHGSSGKRLVITASAVDQYGYSKLEFLLTTFIIGNLVGIAIVALAGYYFARSALKPISTVVEQVNQVTASRLNVRLQEGNQKDEIARLAMTFNLMLDRVQYAFEVRKNFVSHASHELRTPLANVLGTLETSLLYDTDLARAQQSQASAIDEIKQLIELSNGLLALAQLDEKDQVQLAFQDIRIDEVLLEAVSRCQAKYPGQEIQVELLGMPDDATEFIVRGEEKLLFTALLNLLDNACKYSGGYRVTVQFDVAHSTVATIRITDQGIGIEEKDLRFVFDPLFRGQNARSRPGHGIGLPLTRSIVQVHQGQIDVRSQLHHGTTVEVALPLVA